MAIINRELWSIPLAMPQGFEARRRRVDPQVRQALRFFALLVAISLALWLDVLQTSHIATMNYQIDDLNAQRAAIERENARLLEQIANSSSLPQVEKRAHDLGFVPAKDTVYVNLDSNPVVKVAPPTDAGAKATNKPSPSQGYTPAGGHISEKSAVTGSPGGVP